MSLSDTTRTKLETVSVATICTALFKKGLRKQFIYGVSPVGAACRMVGPAFTLRSIPAREDRNPIEIHKDPNHPQRVAIEACPPGAVMVCDSRGDANGASGGDILVARLMMRGAAGVVTDGGFRDSPEIAELDIPAYHARPCPPISLVAHEALESQVPIGCGGAPVFPGDIVVGDGEGVVVIPAEMADEIADEAFEMTAYEDFVAEKVREGRSIIGLYPATSDEIRAEFATWRQANGR
ncbi:MAG: ribonuclease activity regulator RraA [Pseudomonadota bacterium]